MRILIAFLLCWIGAYAQGAGVYEEEFVTREILDSLVKQPIEYQDVPFRCVWYRIETTGVDSKKEKNLLSYVQTSEQFDTRRSDRTDAYIKESVCATGNCEREVRFSKEETEDPFYIVLINARHSDPPLEIPADEPVTVKLTVKSCDEIPSGVVLGGAAGDYKTSERDDRSDADDRDRLIIILICLIGPGLLLFATVLLYNKQKMQSLQPLQKVFTWQP